MHLIGIFLIVILVGLAVWFVGDNGNSSLNPRPTIERSSLTRDAIRILDERYARGEIDRDEYLEKEKDLSSKSN